jgi:hypothetical protein
MIMHRLILAAAFSAALPLAAAEPTPPARDVPTPERIRVLIEITGGERSMRVMADQLIQQLKNRNPGVPPHFWEELEASIDTREIVEMTIPVYQKHLSAADVEEAIRYWQSDSGRRFSEAQPLILGETMPLGREWGRRLFQDVSDRVKKMPARDLYWGYIDKTGKVAIEPKFNGPGQYAFSEGLAHVEIKDTGKCGFIDKAGQFAIEPTFDSAGSFSEGLAMAYVQGKNYGYIDKSARWVIEPVFATARDFSEGLAFVADYAVERKTAFIDKTGRRVIELDPPARDAHDFSGGMAAFVVEDKWGFVDRTGRVVYPPQFTLVRDFKEGLAAVQVGTKWGFVDAQGKTVIEPQYDLALDFSDGIVSTLRDRKWTYIDKMGRPALPGAFDMGGPMQEGLAAVKVGGKWGFIDKAGKTVIAPAFDDVFRFSEGLAAFKSGDKYGYIDRTGKVVIEPQFDRAEGFKDGMALIAMWK